MRPQEAAPLQVTAVVPVKVLARAKTRLVLPDDDRRALALAFALDTISVLTAAPGVCGVLVVTSEPALVRRRWQPEVRVVPDPGAGLVPAVRRGITLAVGSTPTAGVVVVPADLPCLAAADVGVVLRQAGRSSGAFVPDRARTGTTLVVHPPGGRDAVDYGPGSASRHRLLGLRPLELAPLRARHDVDTVADLREACRLGVGPRTGAVVEAMGGRAGTR